ncbi:hypothetical protein EDD73_10775 [Heliophilum fasciatum]|uniref:Helix-turn-helix protein n=1 Tax=Heliophilum fasciatum TaxID=35700 RepID=A0A4R2RP71_9FIRM|nr:hypothetical protein [Heliophilum fasciatum]TCP65003.1 hypothetical protein EDD73_10775 [Heliophilum fasciatum]
MVNYREILRLRSLEYSQRQVAVSVKCSRNTVSEVYRFADEKVYHGHCLPRMDKYGFAASPLSYEGIGNRKKNARPGPFAQGVGQIRCDSDLVME